MDPQQQLANLLMQFLNAGTWADSKGFVEVNPLLLRAEVDALLAAMMVRYKDDEQVTGVLVEHQQLLSRCRGEGIEVAFAERLELESILRQLKQPARPLGQQIELCRRALVLVSKESKSRLWAALQVKLGTSLYQSPLVSRAENLEQAIAAYQAALEVRTRQVMPVKWAETMSDLAATYSVRIRGERAENLEQAIDYYEQALEVMMQQARPIKWAGVMNNLANAYRNRIRGDRAYNLEQAIAYLEHVLKPLQAVPLEWATAMHNLALAYVNRIRGERAQNLEQAIDLYQQALKIRTRQLMPADWAMTMHSLARALAARIRGERAANLEQAIDLYQQALEVRTRQTMPVAWAETIHNLAIALTERIRGERAQNLEQAIALYQQALQVYTRQGMPVDWARTLNNLANVYTERIQGARADNLEQAIDLYQQALTVRSREAMPLEWAATMQNLAATYEARIRGARAENLEQAIDYYQQALDVYTRQALPLDWAQTVSNLALAYVNRIRGNRAQNLEQAIDLYQQALEVRTRQGMPVSWAETMHSLAGVYQLRIRGDRTENLEQAIDLYQQVLQVRTRQAMPMAWAQTMHNLATVVAKRIRGEQADNLEEAIALYEQALQVRTLEAIPMAWAQTKHNLATDLVKRLRGDRAANLEEAIAALKQALQVRTRQAMPIAWGRTMHTLATAYRNQTQGNRAANLEQAIAHYEQVLSVFTRQAMPVDWGTTKHNLALTYTARMMLEDRAESRKQAIDHYKQALQVQTLAALPNQHRQTQRNLGGLYFAERCWAEAHTAYAAALQASELLYQASSTPEARQAELREHLDLPAWTAYCLARLARLTEAVETLEQGKARALGEALARNEATLAINAPAFSAAFTIARERIAALEAEARATDQPGGRDFLAISADLRQTRAELAALVARIRSQVPQFMPLGLEFAGVASVTHTLGQPLVYLLTTPAGSLALIVPPGTKTLSPAHLIWLNQFQTDDLTHILDDHEGKRGYLHGTVLADTDRLKQILTQIWPKLSSNLMAPIAKRLRQLGYQQAVLIPSGTLSLLPLHALTCSQVIFTLAPSARALQTAASTAKQRTSQSPVLLGIGNPLPNSNPLPFARLEVEQISPLFATAHTFYEEAATRQAVASHLTAATHLHFSCHGTFTPQQPLNSALYLANSDTLTLRDLLSGNINLSATRLAVLSACQTGITDFQNVPDEAIGFPAGFLQAGVPAVISTLWPVPDISTAFLLARFYHYNLTDSLEPPVALHKAQNWLREATAKELKLADYYAKRVQTAHQREERAKAFVAMRHYQAHPDVKPFEHPYYWAAFVFSGV